MKPLGFGGFGGGMGGHELVSMKTISFLVSRKTTAWTHHCSVLIIELLERRYSALHSKLCLIVPHFNRF